jgi:hypothetical protein
MPPNVKFPDKPVIKEASEIPAIAKPKPIVEEVIVPPGEVPEVTEVAEVADTEKA